jgi:hypothetical protein
MIAVAAVTIGLGGAAWAGGDPLDVFTLDTPGRAVPKAAVAPQPAKVEGLDAKLLRLIVADLASEHRVVQAAAEHKLVLAGAAALPFLDGTPESARPRAQLVREKVLAVMLRC